MILSAELKMAEYKIYLEMALLYYKDCSKIIFNQWLCVQYMCNLTHPSFALMGLNAILLCYLLLVFVFMDPLLSERSQIPMQWLSLCSDDFYSSQNSTGFVKRVLPKAS